MKRNIQWPRIVAEGSAIVMSILLAFAIDAWWEDRKEAESERAQLETLLGEFKEARHHLALQLQGLEESLRGTSKVIELMGPDATDSASSELRAALGVSLNAGVSAPQQGSLREVLASRAGIDSGDSKLWSRLQTWLMMMDNLSLDGRHLESNRETNFIDALVRLGIPLLDVIRVDESQGDSRLRLPPSNFNADLSILLRDPGIETVFTMRAIRSQLLIGQHKSAIAIADEIIGQLEDRK